MLLAAVATVVLLAVVVALITQPLRAGRRAEHLPSAQRGDLEAARESKYREIRDTELDFQTGKLSREDYDAVDGALRAEAVEILRRMDALGEESVGERAAIEDEADAIHADAGAIREDDGAIREDDGAIRENDA